MDNVARGEKARQIAQGYVGWAVGAGLIPFPLVDIGSLVVLQVKMLTEIAELYGVPLERERARTLVMSTVGSVASQGIALASIPALLKFVPVFGTLLGIATMPAAAAASILALAGIFIRHIETHGCAPDGAWPQLTDPHATAPALVPVPEASVIEPAFTEEPVAVAPAAYVEATGDGNPMDSTDEHDPEESSDDVVRADAVAGTETGRPVRRRRASSRRRSSPAEKS